MRDAQRTCVSPSRGRVGDRRDRHSTKSALFGGGRVSGRAAVHTVQCPYVSNRLFLHSDASGRIDRSDRSSAECRRACVRRRRVRVYAYASCVCGGGGLVPAGTRSCTVGASNSTGEAQAEMELRKVEGGDGEEVTVTVTVEEARRASALSDSKPTTRTL